MKNLRFYIVFTLFMLSSFLLNAQLQGFTYQAVIFSNAPEQIPGENVEGNVLPNHPIIVRFTILDSVGLIVYQEDQKTTTDKYGMINLIVGAGTPTSSSPGTFFDIDWDGHPKYLKVSISLSQTDVFFTDFSYQPLTFIPYAYHKNITATGSMNIHGVTTLHSRLSVTGGSPSFFSGDITVDKKTQLKGSLRVDSVSQLNDQVVITAKPQGKKGNYMTYPLVVKGGKQGIAVKIAGKRSSDNYFISFWDDENLQGRIQGETYDELKDDPDFIMNNLAYANDVAQASLDVAEAAADIVAASTSSTVCVGFGACVTTPVPSLIVVAVIKAVFKAANLVMASVQYSSYLKSASNNIGISFQSGSRDYAEWLPKSDSSETFTAGDIVGVRNGYVSRNTQDANFAMVVTRQAIVVGNMPQPGHEQNYEKISFIGQVPVKVYGKVNPGDYIIPGGKNDGVGVAVSPDNVTLGMVNKIVGVAWEGNPAGNYGMVNVAVGLRANEFATVMIHQRDSLERRINDLQKQIDYMNNTLACLVPGYKPPISCASKAKVAGVSSKSADSTNRHIIIYYHEITRDDILNGINQAEKLLTQKGFDPNKNAFFNKINTEPSYKDKFVNNLVSECKKQFYKMYGDKLKKGNVTLIKY